MYKISVPLINRSVEKQGREKILSDLKRLGAKRVFLAQSTGCCRSPLKEEELAALKTNSDFFKKEGFETGAWLWTFQLPNSPEFTRMTAPDGKVSESLVCPLDGEYIKLQGEFLSGCAKAGVDMIMFDDDFRYGFQDMGFGCVCEKHLELIEKELGEKPDMNTLKNSIYAGGKNKYRDAFIKANGYAFEYFAKRMREYVDSVNPDVRLGFCSCITSWGLDGTTPDKLSRILAGNTKPFYRLIGAPYWAGLKCWGHRMQDVIDFERFECTQNFDKEIEIFSEGDVYPRPRYRVPAAYLEGLDTAMRAAGGTSGMLKYAIDYGMKAGIEDGYIKAAEKNSSVYKNIPLIFDGKNCDGIRLYINTQKFGTITVPESISGTEKIQDISFTIPARAFSANGIPITFEGDGVTSAAFGEDIRIVPQAAFKNGLIIDSAAAEILSQNGIDTGIEEFCGEAETSTERFDSYDTIIPLGSSCKVKKLKLKPSCKIQSVFATPDGEIPASYGYINSNGQKFLVFAFDMYFADEALYRQYARSRQITENIAFLSEKKLPAYLYGSPDAYVMTKTGKNALSLGVWNFSVDEIFDPELPLDGEYKIIKTLNCTAECKNGVLYLSDIAPFAFAAVELEKD